MLRAVLDANVLVSALLRPNGTPGRILEALLTRRCFTLVLSPALTSELRRVSSYERIRKRLPRFDFDGWWRELERFADAVDAEALAEPRLADADDAVYLAAARAGHADLIVSGDHHLLALEVWEGIPLVNPREFATLIAGGEIAEPAAAKRSVYAPSAARPKASAARPRSRRRPAR